MQTYFCFITLQNTFGSWLEAMTLENCLRYSPEQVNNKSI